jgi:hypothetical protein
VLKPVTGSLWPTAASGGRVSPFCPETSGTAPLASAGTDPHCTDPHWVRHTRKAAIRRQDRCDPLSMPEIHDMVLRNARRFDEVNARLTAAEQSFDASFYETLNRICKMSGSGDLKQRVRDWASSQKCSFRGIRVTLVPHQRLAIERLENPGALLPSGSVRWSRLVSAF